MTALPPRFSPPGPPERLTRELTRRRRLCLALIRLLYHSAVAAVGWAVWDGIKRFLP